MNISELQEIEKTENVPSIKNEDWGRLFLSRLLTEISENYGGSVYAEENEGEVEFRATIHKEKMFYKGDQYKVLAKYSPFQLNKFVTFINKEIFKLEQSSLCSGILKVKFKDEDEKRMYTIFSRRSGALGDFIQIDQFKSHL